MDAFGEEDGQRGIMFSDPFQNDLDGKGDADRARSAAEAARRSPAQVYRR
jgi:hypothetical protein